MAIAKMEVDHSSCPPIPNPYNIYVISALWGHQSTDLLDVVVGEGAAILELLASKNQALLVGRDTLLVLNLLLDIVNRVGGLNLERDGLAREGLDEAIHQGYNVPFVSDLTQLRLIASCCGTS